MLQGNMTRKSKDSKGNNLCNLPGLIGSCANQGWGRRLRMALLTVGKAVHIHNKNLQRLA